MWHAVLFGGPDHWEVDPNRTPPVPCNQGPSEVAVGILDNMPPRVKGITVSKYIALARTIKSSDGRILDIVNGKVIETGTAEAFEHINTLQKAIYSKFDFPREALGLFSTISAEEVAAMSDKDTEIRVAPWSPGQVLEIEAFLKEAGTIVDHEPVFYEGKLIEPVLVDNINSEDYWENSLAVLR